MRYLEKPSPWNLPPIAILVLLASSLYLAGVVNAIVMIIITLGLMIYNRPAVNMHALQLVDKEQAIQYITEDWSRSSTSHTISIDYDIDRGIWDGIASKEHAVLLNQWYPASMTERRGFAYEILRRYGLKNEQEGIQLRTFENGRYLVTYAFEDPPQVTTGQLTHHIFGRLRVTTVEK